MYVATSNENKIGINVNCITVASDEPLSVDGTVFDPRPEPEGLLGVDGELPGDAADWFQNNVQELVTEHILPWCNFSKSQNDEK